MFTQADFEAFAAPTLEARMALIRARLDPKFAEAAKTIVPLLQAANHPIFTHIAKHQRRHKNPPPNTWVAFSPSRRGYKMLPHLELGFWDDRLFLWLACLRESKTVPQLLAGVEPMIEKLSGQWLMADDHTNKATVTLNLPALKQKITRFDTIKNAEFLIGQVYLAGDPIWTTPDVLWAEIQGCVADLAPILDQLVRNVAAYQTEK
ncbi:DUF1054 domain-containing protein [Lacticaseibacillus casei]|uniref:Uncharacterized protein n=1 Tax=Lacticaseibacillus casei DSM 20011 = JCM 1134 = ATCC 393 TaxID=1423732 RepID=A0AAD1ANR6_LACCA|nr:DUF1054 family protein [Lacticaseibacillus casei]BAN74219.1 conserved hypothetical protein [Lacticaseibacillus casei DSM 20011 = JCM 1134 = ATCC 393]HAJ54760.1 DUF1054 domain-containing protein [Lactobacillus sp.]MDZ5496828.1 DUF1054 family protein [Lacticaseibacillus casei]MED7630028.1 DUF1054 family protein [Lacticaseibacillus casei]NIG84082.1 DUF1054 family protein [Lacticaseibacillus casei]